MSDIYGKIFEWKDCQRIFKAADAYDSTTMFSSAGMLYFG